MTTLVRYIKSDRGPMGWMAPGEVCGWPDEVARKLIEQGFATLHDAGGGPGVPLPPEANALHLREAWETDDDPNWLKRKATVEAALAAQAKGRRP